MLMHQFCRTEVLMHHIQMAGTVQASDGSHTRRRVTQMMYDALRAASCGKREAGSGKRTLSDASSVAREGEQGIYADGSVLGTEILMHHVQIGWTQLC